MQPQRAQMTESAATDTPHAWPVNAMLVAFTVLLPNAMLALSAAGQSQPQGDSGKGSFISYLSAQISVTHVAAWLALNLLLLGLLFLLRKHLLQPLSHIHQHMQQLQHTYLEAVTPDAPPASLGFFQLARDMGRFASFAREHYRKHQEVSQELEISRQLIAQFTVQQQAIIHSANREIGGQYRAVLTYANYLEEQILHNKIDPSLRYDFDDVSESSFNLKLIAGALSKMATPQKLLFAPVPLAPLMQQTMIALAPALDRRSMKLTTAEVDHAVAAQGDPETLTHILWMMLLGMIRYAADESTLRIRSLYSRDGTEAMMSIVVSELSPGQLTESEREEHLVRQLQHSTPHMFAETIRIHGNVQLADMLITRLGGHISVVPLTISSCEICVTLPSAQITKSCL